LSAQLFENLRIGVSRDLYWSVEFSFEPFEVDGEEQTPNCLVDWVRIRDPEIALQQGLVLSRGQNPEVEVSSYLEATHVCATDWEVSLRPSSDESTWALDYRLVLDPVMLRMLSFDALTLSGNTSLSMGPLVIVKENLSPKVITEDEARHAMEPFFDVSAFEFKDEGFRVAFYRSE